MASTTSTTSTVHHPFGMDPCDQQNHPIFNATTQKRNAVDPRTGLFEAYVPLPSIVGNEGEGPVLDMSLFYSPLVNNHAGLGDGWSFAFTCYREAQQQLTLHSGEVLSVTKGKNAEENKVTVEWSADRLTVTRPEGRVDVLEPVGTSKVWMPVTVMDSLRRSVSLSWEQKPLETSVKQKYGKMLVRDTEKKSLDESYIRLTQISDRMQTLVRLTYTDAAVTLALWPDVGDEHLRYTLSLSDYALQSVTAPDSHICSMTYNDHPMCGRLLQKLTTFEGVQESVTYADNGLIFKDNPKLSALPCVSEHILKPHGSSVEPIVTTYDYKRLTKNDEQYCTTAKQAGEATQTVYIYDKSHELIKETTSEGECTVTRCHSNSNDELFERSTVIAYSKEKGVERSIKSVSRFRGGELLVSFKRANDAEYGTHEFMIGAKGQAFSESDMDLRWGWRGFDCGEAFAGIEFYTYSVEAVFGFEGGRSPAWLKLDLRDVKTNSLLGRAVSLNFAGQCLAGLKEIRKYNHEGVGGAQLKVMCSYLDAKLEWVAFSRKSSFVEVDKGVREVGTEEERNNVRRVTVDKTSIFSGRLIEQTDADGNKTAYTYDAHGRLATLTVCAQSDTYKQTTAYKYPSIGRLEISEPDGRQRASEDDGLGNVIAEFARDDAKQSWRQTLKVDYDNRGRKVKTTRYDYLADGTQVSEWCELKYDAWNQECQQVYSTGQQLFNHYDPVAHTRTEWSGKQTDKQRKVTTYNIDDSVASIVWKNADGKQFQQETLTYTHAGQVLTRTTEGEGSWRCTIFTYDDAGRMLAQAHDERTKADAKDKTTYTYTYEYPENWLMTEPTKISLDGQVLGEREFDAWGRVTRLTRGDVSETYQYQGASNVPKTRTGADGITLAFEYFPELGNEVKSVTGKDAQDKALGKQTFSYRHGTTRQSSASEGGQTITFDHDVNEQVTCQHAKLKDKAESTLGRSTTPAGRLLSETDAAGNKAAFSYNAKGQRSKVSSAGITTTHSYDARGRLDTDTVALGSDQLSVSYGYDSSDRELHRQFTLADAFNLRLSRTFSDEGRLQSIKLYDEQANKELGSHSYTYTPGGALASCSSTGVWQPKNPKGKAISKQVFSYDRLGNVTECISTFGDQSCTSTYSYASAKGYRLEKVGHSHADYKKAVAIEYDPAGRVTKDHTGKTYAYDWLGRLAQAGSRHYTYDPLNRLASSANKAGDTPHQLVHDGYRVRGEYPGEQQDYRYVAPGSAACQVQKNKAGSSSRTLFNLCDDDGSVLISFDVVSRKPVHHAYSAYGEHSSEEQAALQGYNGEYREADGDQYPLGRGYRWYAPHLMQFQAQDRASPFDRGGPNAYGYCEGDPVNHTDPTGQWKRRREHWDYTACEPAPMGLGKQGALISAIIFGAITVISAVMSGGTSLLITAALVALAVVSAATAIAGALVAESDPEASRILGWVSLGTGVAGGVANVAKKLGQIAIQLARSGKNVARHVLQKSAQFARNLRRGPSQLPKSVARPTPGALRNIVKDSLGELRIGEIDRLRPNMRNDYTGAFRSIVKEDSPLKLAFKALDFSDANPVLALATGSLGMLEADGDGAVHKTDSWVVNATTLPWGDFGKLWR